MIRKWNRKCIRWRKTCIRRLARKYQRVQNVRRFRTCLAAVLCVEVLAGAGLFWNQNRPEFSLVRREQICEVELIPKTAGHGAETVDDGNPGETGNSSGAGNAAAPDEQDIYGIRLDLEALEVQFYHRKDVLQEK